MSMRVLLGAMLVASLSLCPHAEARSWKPTPSSRAFDYLEIVDHRANNEVVLLWWTAPPMIPESPGAKDLFDKYIVIAVVDAHIDVGGTATFSEGNVELKDAAGNPLKLVADADMPPGLMGAIVAMHGMMEKIIGNMGKGMRLYAFEAGSVHACTKGQLSVAYAGETYTYDTPIPGCEGD